MNLSIIIPVYNAEKYIEKCITIIMNQDQNNLDYEVIIINDGSFDNSLAIIKKLGEKYSNIKIFSQENKGVSVARNVGIKNATGNYIWFIDADDFIEQNSFQLLEKFIVSLNFDFIHFGYNKLDKENVICNTITLNKETITNGVQILEKQEALYLWNNLFKKQLISKNNFSFLEGTINIEDFEFSVKFFNKARKGIIIPIVLYNYYENDQSTSRNKSRKNLIKLAEDSFTVHLSLQNYIKKKPKIITEMIVNKSIAGFFYSLLVQPYNFSDLKKYYKRYEENSLLPLKTIKNEKFSLICMFKLINNKKLFYLFFKLYKILK
ncbi:glycosyltransferase [Flavobacterium sp.]|uniref:glycosyltransferase n=1 Tax=Flavobacterium sp. TaxID=239 RepID=UPI003F69B132